MGHRRQDLVCKGDITRQTRQVFKGIQTILAEAGASLRDVVKITIFAADISYRDAINKVRARSVHGALSRQHAGRGGASGRSGLDGGNRGGRVRAPVKSF